MTRIPTIYLPATLYAITPLEPEIGSIGLAFDMGKDEPVRVLLSKRDRETLLNVIHSLVKNDHPAMSSGMPSTEVSSTPRTEKVCPPAKSPAAARADE